MGDVINLGRYRREKEDAKKRADADANRLKFGRRKSENLQDRSEFGLRERLLDASRIDHDEDDPKR